MKKVIRQESTYVPQIVSVEKYLTEDGQEFNTEEEALIHEEYQKISKKRFDHTHYFTIDGDWHFFNSESEMKRFTCACNYEELGVIEYPAWILYQRVESYNYEHNDDYYVCSVDQVRGNLVRSLEFVNSL